MYHCIASYQLYQWCLRGRGMGRRFHSRQGWSEARQLQELAMEDQGWEQCQVFGRRFLPKSCSSGRRTYGILFYVLLLHGVIVGNWTPINHWKYMWNYEKSVSSLRAPQIYPGAVVTVWLHTGLKLCELIKNLALDCIYWWCFYCYMIIFFLNLPVGEGSSA